MFSAKDLKTESQTYQLMVLKLVLSRNPQPVEHVSPSKQLPTRQAFTSRTVVGQGAQRPSPIRKSNPKPAVTLLLGSPLKYIVSILLAMTAAENWRSSSAGFSVTEGASCVCQPARVIAAVCPTQLARRSPTRGNKAIGCDQKKITKRKYRTSGARTRGRRQPARFSTDMDVPRLG